MALTILPYPDALDEQHEFYDMNQDEVKRIDECNGWIDAYNQIEGSSTGENALKVDYLYRLAQAIQTIIGTVSAEYLNKHHPTQTITTQLFLEIKRELRNLGINSMQLGYLKACADALDHEQAFPPSPPDTLEELLTTEPTTFTAVLAQILLNALDTDKAFKQELRELFNAPEYPRAKFLVDYTVKTLSNGNSKLFEFTGRGESFCLRLNPKFEKRLNIESLSESFPNPIVSRYVSFDEPITRTHADGTKEDSSKISHYEVSLMPLIKERDVESLLLNLRDPNEKLQTIADIYHKKAAVFMGLQDNGYVFTDPKSANWVGRGALVLDRKSIHPAPNGIAHYGEKGRCWVTLPILFPEMANYMLKKSNSLELRAGEIHAYAFALTLWSDLTGTRMEELPLDRDIPPPPNDTEALFLANPKLTYKHPNFQSPVGRRYAELIKGVAEAATRAPGERMQMETVAKWFHLIHDNKRSQYLGQASTLCELQDDAQDSEMPAFLENIQSTPEGVIPSMLDGYQQKLESGLTTKLNTNFINLAFWYNTYPDSRPYVLSFISTLDNPGRKQLLFNSHSDELGTLLEWMKNLPSPAKKQAEFIRAVLSDHNFTRIANHVVLSAITDDTLKILLFGSNTPSELALLEKLIKKSETATIKRLATSCTRQELMALRDLNLWNNLSRYSHAEVLKVLLESDQPMTDDEKNTFKHNLDSRIVLSLLERSERVPKLLARLIALIDAEHPGSQAMFDEIRKHLLHKNNMRTLSEPDLLKPLLQAINKITSPDDKAQLINALSFKSACDNPRADTKTLSSFLVSSVLDNYKPRGTKHRAMFNSFHDLIQQGNYDEKALIGLLLLNQEKIKKDSIWPPNWWPKSQLYVSIENALNKLDIDKVSSTARKDYYRALETCVNNASHTDPLRSQYLVSCLKAQGYCTGLQAGIPASPNVNHAGALMNAWTEAQTPKVIPDVPEPAQEAPRPHPVWSRRRDETAPSATPKTSPEEASRAYHNQAKAIREGNSTEKTPAAAEESSSRHRPNMS